MISATNTGGQGTANLAINVVANPNAPVITSALTKSGNVNSPFSYQISATQSPTSYTATPLPAGLSVSPSGLISGTPTATGTSTVSLGASNASGPGAARTLTIAISPAGADINPALNKPVTLSDAAVRHGNVGGYVVDGLGGVGSTRWESPANNLEWIYVDLGARCNIHAVNLDWETACGGDYMIEVSSNKVDWTNFVPPIVGNKTTGWLYYPRNATGQYVRMNGTSRATTYGYSL